MIAKELDRVEVMGRVKAGALRLVEAAEMLSLSYRQGKRVWARYRVGGGEALAHRGCCRESNRGYGQDFRVQVIRRYEERYGDFGPTLAAEHLGEEDGLRVSAETLRRWLREAGHKRLRRRKPYRRRRERRAHFGELVQMDGSFHDWLEERAGRGCLMHMVDDATSQAEACFFPEETIWAAVGVLRRWIEKYGIPRTLYTDWKNVYVREATEAEKEQGLVPLTQFGRMCQCLGIEILAAGSPQAKGRVERAHGTHQDRLVKKLRLAGIGSYEEANRYLAETYLPAHNRRYAQAAASAADYHRRRPSARELAEAFCLEEERVVGADWVVRYQTRFFQLERQSRHYAPAKTRVTVREKQEGKLVILYRNRPLRFTEIAGRPAPKPKQRPAPPSHSPTSRRVVNPPPSHPWKRPFKWQTAVQYPPKT
ncbi:ISNCY family transposase [Verrucomicrobium sp. 3C]|uniref:ISNCY family transposase n=1 Tax=Verrucomicrobium sp. 3C TaxID=1134055 RepID=UPI00036C13E2|nr:ISNCY family transposase [Verrucomicrobium sp. 3C]